ncbi:MAG: DMT family transporter [Pseudomonadota bacterium]|nr:DMT family transporter [Pseudomonadota bacterium]
MYKDISFSLDKISNLSVCWVLLFVLGAIWGSSFLCVDIALKSFSPLQIAASRIFIGALLLTGLSISMGYSSRDLRLGQDSTWLYCLGMAIFTNALPFSLLCWAQLQVSSSFAGISMTMVPLLIIPLAHFFIPREQFTVRKILGVSIGSVGILMLFGLNDTFQEIISSANFLPKIACVLAALCYAIGSIITKRSPEIPQLVFSSTALVFASLLIIPPALFLGHPLPSDSNWAILSLVYLGVAPTGLATLILVYIIKTIGPSFLSKVNFLVPIWAVIFGVYFNNEILHFNFLTALFLIFLGIFISQQRAERY